MGGGEVASRRVDGRVGRWLCCVTAQSYLVLEAGSGAQWWTQGV